MAKGNRLLAPDCPIQGLPNITVGDFWSWAYSDILSNRNRSIFAEFIVGALLGVLDYPRVEWDSVDLRYGNVAIEVKSAGYVQSWKQNGLSKIVFDISRKIPWDADTNTFGDKPIRSADLYVFCLFADTDPTDPNVLDLRMWRFWAVPTTTIENECGNQKSISLSRLNLICQSVDHTALKQTIDHVMAAA